MNITDVRIRKISDDGKMRAVASITLDDEFVVHDIKIIDGQNGLFIAMPSKKMSDGASYKRRRYVVHVILYSEEDILSVLGTHVLHIEPHVRKIYSLVVADLSSVYDRSSHLCVIGLFNFYDYLPVVYKDQVAGLHFFGKILVCDGNSLGSA